jgi:hypothetical protein
LIAEESKEEKRARKRRERASQSAMMDVIRETYTDAPEEITTGGLGTSKKKRSTAKTAQDSEKQDYEEKAFIRLPTTAKDRKKKERAMLRSDLDDVEDYGEIASFLRTDGDDEFASAKQSKESKFLSELQKVCLRTLPLHTITTACAATDFKTNRHAYACVRLVLVAYPILRR